MNTTSRRFMLSFTILIVLLMGAWSSHSFPATAQGAATMPATMAATMSGTMSPTATNMPSMNGAGMGSGAPITSCDVPAGTTAATPAADTITNAAQGDIKVGVAISLSGAAQPYGDTQQKGLLLAQSQINKAGGVNGKKIGLVIEDTKSVKDQATIVFQDLINQKVVAILGPTLSNEAAAADVIAQQASVPVMGMSNAGNGIVEIGDYVFRDSIAEAVQVPATVRYAKDVLGIKTVAILYAQDDKFSSDAYDVYKAELGKAGINILDTEPFNNADTDFSAQLTKIQGLNPQPDAIVVSALLKPASAVLNKARDLGLKQPILGGNGFNSPLLLALSKQAAENTYFAGAWSCGSTTPMNAAFVKAYIDMWGAAPDQFAAQSYSALVILADAL